MTLMVGGGSSGTAGRLGAPKLAPKLAPPKPSSSPSGLRAFPIPGAGFQMVPPPKPPSGGPRALAPTSSGGAGFLLTPQPGAPTNSHIQVPDPFESTPKVPQVPTSAAGPTVGTKSGPAPLDQIAMANIAAYINKANNSMADLGVAGTNDQTRYQSSYDALTQQNPLADLRLMTAANDRGGFYGSAYGQQLGNLNQQYQGKEGALYQALLGQQAAIASRTAGLQSSIPAYESQQAADAAARLAKLALTAPPPATPPSLAAVVAQNNPPVFPGGSAAVLKAALPLPASWGSGSVAGPVGGFRFAGAPPGARAPRIHLPKGASKAPPKAPPKAAPSKPKASAKPGTFHLVRG